MASALRILLETSDFPPGLQAALAELGIAADVDRVYIFENHTDPADGRLLLSQRNEWVRAGIPPQIGNTELQNFPWEPIFTRWMPILRAGGHIASHADDMPAREADHLHDQGIQSIAMVPIYRDGTWWGQLGFDICRERREWSVDVIEALHAAAAGIGGALSRRKFEETMTAQAEELRRSRKVALSLMEDARLAERHASEASEAKSSFLAMMSHEIRTPLNSILGFTELTLAESPAPPIDAYAKNISASGRLLLNLVNDILDFAKIEARRITLAPEPGSVRDAIETVLTSLRRSAEDKPITLESEISDSVPSVVLLDFVRFHQLLLNFVGNAVKFTSRGSVRVSATAQPLETGGVRIFVEISDTGIGIDSNAMARIFEPFSQAHSAVHRRFGGTGLGLAICRQLCELMGGTITVSSKLGEGSTFRFDLLAALTTSEPKATFQTGSASSVIPVIADPAHPLRILVVDDVPANRQLARSLLQKMGFSPEVAEDGEAAVALAAAQSFDVILMDIFMPGIDGHEASRQILENAAAPPPFIVALSADVTQENRDVARRSGMREFLAKPLRVADLAAALRTAATERNGESAKK